MHILPLRFKTRLPKALPDFQNHFAATTDDYESKPELNGPSQLGNAIFYRQDLPILAQGDFFICNGFNSYRGSGDWATLGHNAVFIKTKLQSQDLTICSVHGNSQPSNKLDSPLRLAQSQKILDFLAEHEGAKIVMGDFNLMPNTESIKLFEAAGFRNLIAEFAIKTTRGSMMRQLHPEYEHGEFGFQEFADYAFVSPEIEVEDFQVPDEPISDHLPMILKIKG